MKRPNDVLGGLAKLRDSLSGAGWKIVYDAEPEPHQRRLMEAMGLEVVVDRDRPAGVVASHGMEASAHDIVQTRMCRTPGCDQEAYYTRGVGAGHCHAHGHRLFVEHGRRTNPKGQPKPARPLPDGTPLNKQSVQLGILGTRVENAAKRAARARAKADEAEAALTASLDQYTEQLRASIARAVALRELTR